MRAALKRLTECKELENQELFFPYLAAWGRIRPPLLTSRFRLSPFFSCSPEPGTFGVSCRSPNDIFLGVPGRLCPRCRGDWHSFEPYPQLIAPIVTVLDGPTQPFVATAERLVRLCA